MLYLPSVGSVNETTEDGIFWISTNPKKTRMYISHLIWPIVVCIKNPTFSSKTLEYEILKHTNFYTKPKSSELKRSSEVREKLGFSQSLISSCVWDFWDWIGVSQRKEQLERITVFSRKASECWSCCLCMSVSFWKRRDAFRSIQNFKTKIEKCVSFWLSLVFVSWPS